MVGRPIIALLLVVLLLPLVSAYGVEKVWVEWQGTPVKTISPAASLPGTVLKAKLTNDTNECFPGGTREESNCVLVLKAGSLSTIPSEQQFLNDTRLIVKNCRNDAAGIICSSAPFTFSSKKPSHSVQSTLRIGGNYAGTHTIAVTIDNTTPRAIALDVGYCAGEQCYVSTAFPAPFTVRFEDTTTSFDYKQVYVGNSRAFGAAASCTGKSCLGTIKVPCIGNGDVQTVEIISAAGVPSAEDAQNPVQGMTRRVTCTDASAQFLEPVTEQAGGNLGVPTTGGSIIYKAQVRAPYGTPRAVLNTQSINGQEETVATCSRESADAQLFACTWQVTGLKTGKHDVQFTVYDGTGSKDSHTLPMKLNVLNVTLPENNATVDLFTVQVKEVIPERLNRLAVELAATNSLPYPAYVVYDIQPRKAGVSVIRQELDQCWYRLPNETNYNNSRKYNLFSRDRGETRVLYPTRNHADDNRLNIQLRPNSDVLALSDRFDVTCQLKLIVTDETGVYSTPELENVTFPLGLRESPLGTPGEKFVQEIKDEEERLNGPASEFLLTLREVRATLDGVCQVMEGIAGLQTVGTSTETAGQAVYSSIVGSPFGGPIKAVGDAVQGVTTPIIEHLWHNSKATDPKKQEGFMRKVCKQVNCRNVADAQGNSVGSWNQQDPQSTAYGRSDAGFVNSLQTTDSKNSGVKFLTDEATKNLNAPNFQDSLVSSIMYQCVGGIVHNVGKWQDINCGYLQCLKEQSINGGSVAVCEQARDAKVCMQVTGEVFELPFARVVKNLAANIDGMIQNAPSMLVKYAANQFCKKASPECAPADWSCTGCHIVKAITDTVDFAQQSNQMYNTPMYDDAICLEALCNEEDGDCKRSYNRIEQYSKYASYLQVNAWLKNKQKQSSAGAEAQQAQAAARALQNAMSGAGVIEASAGDGITGNAVAGETVVIGTKTVAPYKTPQPYMRIGAQEIAISTTQYNALVSGGMAQRLPNGQYSVALSSEQIANIRNPPAPIPASMLPPPMPRQVQPLPAAQQYQVAVQMRNGVGHLYASRNGKFEYVGQISKEKYDQITEQQASGMLLDRSASVYTIKPDQLKGTGLENVFPQTAAKANSAQSPASSASTNTPVTRPEDTPAETAAEGPATPTTLETIAEPLPLGRSLTELLTPAYYVRDEDGGYVGYNDRGERVNYLSEDHPASAQMNLWLSEMGIDPALASNPDTFNTVLHAAENGVILRTSGEVTYYYNRMRTFGEGASGQVMEEQVDTMNAYQRCGTDAACQEKARIDMGKQGIYQQGSLFYFRTGQVTDQAILNDPILRDCTASICLASNGQRYVKEGGNVFESRSVHEEVVKGALQAEKNINYWQTFDFIAGIAAKWAYDEGYLNFLQTSTYGEWGRDASEWSNTYISPEGWQENLCNNIYSINDNDDGVILEPSDDSFTRVAGTFAAEVREITNESGTSYVYIYTLYVSNPPRPVAQGQQGNGNLYNYRMDAFFDQPVECATGDCAKQKDIIDGRFKLDEGVNFANGAGPRRGVLYLPAKYSRLCITFDKPFPSATGKKSYCRPVMENVYDVGSPYVPDAIRDGPAGTTSGTNERDNEPQEDPDGSGSLEGEV